MVEVVGTAPTSVMFITKFVYRHSWKTNTINIKLFSRDSINYFKMKLTKKQQQEIAVQKAQKNSTKRVTSSELEKIIFNCIKKIKPKIVKVLKKNDYDLISENHLDSFDIMNLIIEIEKKTKMKINSKKITEKSFKNVQTIKRLLN